MKKDRNRKNLNTKAFAAAAVLGVGAVAAASFALYLIWDMNCVFLVLMGIAAGLAICEVYERRGGNGDGAA